MPAQTTERSYMKIADGTKVEIMLPSEETYTDLGVVTGDVNIVLEYDEVQEESANAGKSDLYVKNPTVKGDFTLQNLNLANVSKLASGLMTKVTTSASANTDAPSQVIAAGWTDNTSYEIKLETSATDDTLLKLASAPVFTSVKLGAGEEVLVEDAEYVVAADSNAFSGWSIQFMGDNMTLENEHEAAITLDFGSNVPVARDTYHIGTSVQKLVSFALRLVHTDSNDLDYGREIHECYTNSGSLAFSYKSAAEGGFNEMPFNFTGVLSTSLTNGRQLMSVYEDTGAE